MSEIKEKTWDNAIYIYHGTTKKLLNRITFIENGLLTPNSHNFPTNFSQSKKDCLYVTTSLSRAIHWANHNNPLEPKRDRRKS
jgi:hypothetical protein